MTTIRILAVLTGRATPLGDTDKRSGIAKRRRFGPVRIGILGLADDEQGDTVHHGGPEKAIHHYPYDHYAPWSAEVAPPTALLASPGAFGENISTLGITERNVCLGDVYQLGSAIVQVSQSRQPCWRLNYRFGCANMARDIQASGRTGWYYRVRQVGLVAEGDELVLIERPCPAWPLSSVIDLLYCNTLDLDRLRSFLDSLYCPPSWRKLVERRIVTGRVENWQSRLGGVAE
jgi:MOSC domain-containing protein YiiM